jgi:hypothetical protein
MEIILYAAPESITGQVLEKLLKTMKVQSGLIRFYSMQQFSHSVHKNRFNNHIIIAVIEHPKEFILLHSLFTNNEVSNLIIVCDDTPEMISLAHELRPRFLAHANEAIKVRSVVEKMVQSGQSEGESV